MNKGHKYGSIGNIAGKNYWGTGSTKGNGYNTLRKSAKGYYYTAFVKEYAGLSDRDLELKLEYGIDLVSQYTGVPKDMLSTRKKSEKQTVTSIDTVYYIRRGQESIGKLSIRSQRRFRDKALVFVYLDKRVYPKEASLHQKTKRSQGYTNKTTSQKRRDGRYKKKSKATY